MNNIRLKTPVLLIIIIITIITHTCQYSNSTGNVVQMFTSTDVHKVFSQSFNIWGEKHLITQIYPAQISLGARECYGVPVD